MPMMKKIDQHYGMGQVFVVPHTFIVLSCLAERRQNALKQVVVWWCVLIWCLGERLVRASREGDVQVIEI